MLLELRSTEMCEKCLDGLLGWYYSDRLEAFVLGCNSCGYEDASSATQDESVLEPVLEM